MLCVMLCAFINFFTSFKVPLWSNSRCPFFYIFVHNRFVLVILPNFYLLRTLELMFSGPFSRESTAAINFPCSKFWLRIGENDVIKFSKIPHGLK